MMAIIDYKLNVRYEIERELGRGGLGVVYLARDTHLDSHLVVIKTMLDAQAGSADEAWLRKKFDEEIVALLRIKHRSVVGITDSGWMRDGRRFFVMPYVEGETLRSVMCDHGMDLKRAANIIRELGSALSAAHAVGVIHRDLKPENVMLKKRISGEEEVFLIDFGIATVRDLQAERHEQTTRSAGTLPYMAPEQLRGRPIPASDVWALGVVAYEMATGRRPFAAVNYIELGDMQQAGVKTKPRDLRPELPEAAQAVILKALSYDPSERYALAYEMGEQFQRAVLESEGLSFPPPKETTARDYPAEANRQTALPTPPPLYELLRRCRNLFEELEEFTNPINLRAFFRQVGLNAYTGCVRMAAEIDLTHLLDCMSRSGRHYRGQALVDLLALLAFHYREGYQGQECDGLRGSLMQLFTQSSAAGR